jgi:hypothetical protein
MRKSERITGATNIEDLKARAIAFVTSVIDIFAQENPTAGVYSMYVVTVEVEGQGSA